ncbi:MAG: polyprenyl synthetase family protein [Cyanobacteria bacterium K_Offshore_surface_m2_239]|nr:polyprenyl synthetase family protein [Cyanobacteria bacterium K_Offshore_surface_m2_239]
MNLSFVDNLNFRREVSLVETQLAEWVESCDKEMIPELRWQFISGSKYFRPLTIFSTYRSLIPELPIPDWLIRCAVVIELFHNMTLVIDDILDKSPERRGRATLHQKFGELDALMASGYMVAEGYRMLGTDVQAIELFSELMKRLGVAECLQWRLRRQVLGVEDWRHIAAEDTGSMFEICACLADRSGRLRTFGGLLGLLYHGCDDVGDVRGSAALGGGGVEDLRDGILTLPAALAIRDPEIGSLFSKESPSLEDLQHLSKAFQMQLPEAERYLDQVVSQARKEAELFANDPEPLYALIAETRKLSGG